MNETITVPGRDIRTVTTEIRLIIQDTRQVVLSAAIRIGQRLVEAKELVPHGEWGDYLEHEVEFSQSTANNFMRLYEEYGEDRQGLFASINSQSLGNLPYTKVLKLLALPAEERETFVAENDVESMSTRELQKVIRERDEARKALDATQDRVVDLEGDLEDREIDLEKARDRIREAIEDSEKLREQAKAAQRAAAEQEKKLAAARDDVKRAREAEKAAKAALKKAQENPQVPESVLEAMRAEAQAQAAENARKEMEQKLAAAQKQVEEAEAKRADAQAKCDAAVKREQLANPDAAVFQVIFDQVQREYNRLYGALLKVKTGNPELGKKLEKAVLAMLENQRKGLG